MKNLSLVANRSVTGKHIAARTLMLALTLGSGPLLATGQDQPVVCTAPMPGMSHSPNVASSRINGRINWDIDYPSQLGPQPLPPSRNTNLPATTLSISDKSSSAEWNHPSP